MAEAPRKRPEPFGEISKLPSGNYRARYTAPDGKRYSAPNTFRLKDAARAWLGQKKLEIDTGAWQDPESAAAAALVEAEKVKRAAREAKRRETTLAEFAAQWIATRTNSRGEPLRVRTREEYERLLRAAGTKGPGDDGGPLAPLLEEIVGDITTDQVRAWRASQIARGTMTQTSRAYDLLKSIMKTAVEDGIATNNPCTVRGGSTTSTGKKVEPPTDEELEIILSALEPKYRALTIVAAIGGLRFGEATALRAKQVTVERDEDGRLKCVRLDITEAVVKTTARREVGKTKSEAGTRKVAIFGEDAQAVAEQVQGKIGDALLFTAADGASFLPQTTFYGHWAKARAVADRSDMPFHALRHFAGTRYAQTGATVKETMARLGHSSEKAAMRYQHSGDRDDELAMRMSRRTSA
jgi:integrase